MKQVSLIIAIALLFIVRSTVSAQTLPYDVQATASGSQYIRTGPGTSYGIMTSVSTGQRLVAYGLVSGWYQLYLPSPTGLSYGYALSGTGYMVYDGCSGFVAVQNTFSSGLNIRTGPGTSYSTITISGSTAKGWDTEKFGCTGSTLLVSGSTWYQVYLTNDCSSTTGWVSDGHGTGYNYLIYTAPVGTPLAPSGLSAASASCSTINLSWSPSVGASGYDIYDCGGSLITTVSGTIYTVAGLTALTFYSYKVRAVSSCGSSSFTSCQGATTLSCGSAPSTPAGFTATATSCSTIVVSWSGRISPPGTQMIKMCLPERTYGWVTGM
jgi:uncharacterized protein YraI